MTTKFVQVVEPARFIHGIVDERRPLSVTFEGDTAVPEDEPEGWNAVLVFSAIILLLVGFGVAITYTLGSFLHAFYA
jgi:hypothetical protein